jgi:non-heme chloroperoxidase
MTKLTVGQENGHDIEIHYEDHGFGQPVVLIHGFPLDGRSWDKQERVLLEAGYRVISYDRRGFGESSRTTVGFDYDTFADDLHQLLEHLDLRDVVLVGFSMGTGEVTRYLGRHGSGRVSKAALLATVPPYLRKADDNPEGVDPQVFEDIKAAIVADRPAYLKDFLDNFFNVDVFSGTRISESAWQAAFASALQAGPHAVHACVDTWGTDFRDDLSTIDVPVLVVHGTADRVLPYHATAARMPDLLPDLTFITVQDGPHNIAWTHPEVVNPALLDFLKS